MTTATVDRGSFSGLVSSTGAAINTGFLDIQGTNASPRKTINVRVHSSVVTETFSVELANVSDGSESVPWVDISLDASGNADFVLTSNSRRYLRVYSTDVAGDKTINYACSN